MDDYEIYEEKCEKIKMQNKKYLEEFYKELQAKGLKEKTIRIHYNNVDFYLNTFLLHEDALSMECGCEMEKLDFYFEYFFIRKCMWSNPTTLKNTVASFKKFYKCMFEKGYITKNSFSEFSETVKESRDFWIENCEEYNSKMESCWNW